MADPDYSLVLTPEGKATLQALEDLSDVTIKVGWQSGGGMKTADGAVQPNKGKTRDAGGAVKPSPASLAEIAAYNELGTSTIPARPFLSQAFENGQNELNDFISDALSRVSKSGKVGQFLQLLGVKLVDMVATEIEEGDFAPNSPATIARKGSAHPLIDTGTLKDSVGFEIEGD